MKPFNLERALAGYPVVDGVGRKVIDFHHFEDAAVDCCVVALLAEGAIPTMYSRSGANVAHPELSLFMETQKGTRWIVIVADAEDVEWVEDIPYQSESEAMIAAGDIRGTNRLIGVFPVEIEV